MLHDHIALRIEREILADPSRAMPTMRELARQFDVSTRTMGHAVKILASQGKIAVRQGRRMVRASSMGPAKPDDAAGLLYRDVREKIGAGQYRAGDVLPKLDFFVSKHRIARSTITEAIRRLAKENLVHKHGKRWTVGPPAADQSHLMSTAGPSQWPVAIVVAPTENSWFTLFDNPHTGSFMESLKGELTRYGVELFLVQMDRPENGYTQAPAGINELRSCITRFGGRYIGGIICHRWPAPDIIGPWAIELSCHGKKPVAYFDQANEGSECTRKGLSLGASYYRLYFDEASAVHLAVSHLIDSGHRIIGLPTTTEWNKDWALQRLNLAREFAAGHHAQIVTAVLTEPFWKSQFALPEEERFGSWIRQIREHAGLGSGAGLKANRSRPLQRQVLASTPCMAGVLKQGITALVALNDWLAQPYFLWCKAAGIDIPRHISMISFDNIPASVVLPVSTIDFGLARLGYLAAHILLDDFSVTADQEGAIAGLCSIVNRGSVSRPGGTRA